MKPIQRLFAFALVFVPALLAAQEKATVVTLREVDQTWPADATVDAVKQATLAAQVPGRIVAVAENHTVNGGLGEAVAGLLMRNGVHPAFRQIALPDAFLDAGALPTLHDRYGISTEAICASVKSWR